MTHFVGSQDRLRLEGEGLPGNGVGFGAGAQRRQPVSGDIVSGQYRQNPRRGARGSRVDSINPRVSMRRAQYHRMRQILKGEVIEIAAAPGQKAQILPPLRRVADLGAG